jgi:NAD(P)-dependent dehydrogenase (short-subunit alcohol dehydrogenase family)
MTSPVVLITGALTGIGRATALAFAQEGAHLVVSGRREEAGGMLVTGASIAVDGGKLAR